jgi:GNAT superfamily N-acetyltransferase
MEKIRIEEGTFKDYLQLEVYHYKGFRPAFPKKIFKAVYGDEVVGVIVYTMSFLNNRGRVVVFGSDLKDKAKRGEILRIARVVVAPRFRGIGLGSRLVSETLEKAGAEIVEALAAMAVYNPFFEKAGMKLGYVYTGDEKLLRKYVDLLEGYGFDPNRMHSYSHLKTVIMNMPDERLKSFQMELSKITLKRTVGGWLKLKNRLKTGDVQREKLATYLMQYATLQTKTYYYYWKK